MIEFAPLTAERYVAVVGAPPQRTVRGFAMVEGEHTVLVVGMYADEERHVIFSQSATEWRARFGEFSARRAVVMAARKAQEMMAQVKGPVDAAPAVEFAHTEGFLRRLGFTPQPGGEYRYDKQALMRHKLYRAEAVMRKLPQVEIPVQHFFSDGVYARHGRIPAGTMLTGKIHKRWNLNILSEGEMTVLTAEGMKRLKGPHVIVSPPGLKRVAYCHTDCVWTTIHGTHETDVDKIEAEFIASSEQEWLEYATKHQLLAEPQRKRIGGPR